MVDKISAWTRGQGLRACLNDSRVRGSVGQLPGRLETSMQFSDKTVPYVPRALRQAAGPPFTDIDLLIIYTLGCCESENSCLHGPNAKSKDLTRVPICIHWERSYTTPTPRLCRQAYHIHHACSPRRKFIPINNSSPQGIAMS